MIVAGPFDRLWGRRKRTADFRSGLSGSSRLVLAAARAHGIERVVFSSLAGIFGELKTFEPTP